MFYMSVVYEYDPKWDFRRTVTHAQNLKTRNEFVNDWCTRGMRDPVDNDFNLYGI